ncbi:hypothetical protein G6F46_013740 [Rhizopus delemar]|nr:hypothetical protein G6F46_013740 [Rhizopus delemar]
MSARPGVVLRLRRRRIQAMQRRRSQLADGFEECRAHFRGEALGVVGAQHQQADSGAVGFQAQGHQRQRFRRAVQPTRGFERGIGAAIRRLQAVGKRAHVLRDGFAVTGGGQRGQVPQA